MRAIILAAGEGSRLRPLTNDVPKCMVKANGKSMIEYQFDALKRHGIDDIVVVKGYKEDVLVYPDIRYAVNKLYDKTNMVYSLFCAEEYFDEDILLLYGDIVYTDKVLKSLLDAPSNFCMTIDKDWLKLWSARNEHPINDAETLILDNNNNILELGKKPTSLDEIQGQYMGLIKIKKNTLKKVQEFYHKLDKTRFYEGRDIDNMFATTFFQLLIDSGMDIQAVLVDGGWIEVDIPSDLDLFETFLPELY